MDSSNRTAVGGLLIAVAGVLCTVLVFHLVKMDIRMRRELEPIASEFMAVAAHPRGTQETLTGEGVTRTLDYGGKIDAIIARRDSVLEANGYIMLGSWRVGMNDGKASGHISAEYIRIPWLGGQQ